MTLTDHLELYLGEISGGWNDPASQNAVQVVVFEGQPFKDINTYITLGLSDFLFSTSLNKPCRQELVFMAYKNFDAHKIASFLSTLAANIIASGTPLLRGSSIGPSGPIIFGVQLNSIYVAIPMILPEGFGIYEQSTPCTTFPWIIPIHEEEANYIRANGWSKFEVLLEAQNPELWDLHRPPIVKRGK
jgi:hypothetical protein